jgi:hypothetical protein
MTQLKAISAGMFIAIFVYTIAAISNDGWNLVPIFVGNLLAFTWNGQFNLDFAFYLMLSGIWIAWRHNFSGAGIALGLVASVAGMLFFAVYLFVVIGRSNNNVEALLLGEKRAKTAL